MSRQALLSFVVELLWLILIVAASFLAVMPVWDIISRDFVMQNLLLGLCFFYLFRMVVFFRQLFFLKNFIIQLVIFIAAVPAFFFVLNRMQEMVYLFDTYDLSVFLAPDFKVAADQIIDTFGFYKREFLFFSTGVLVLLALLEIRLALVFVERVRKIE